MYSPTESEFAAFPPTLKRKCFSTLERLRYAQAQVRTAARDSSRSRPRRLSTTNASHNCWARDAVPAASKPLIRVRTLFASHGSFTGGRQCSRSRRLRPSSASLDWTSQENALWFSQLPEKVKRTQFSVQEQAALGGREAVILDAADEKFYKLRERPANRSLPSLASSSSDCSSIRSLQTLTDTSIVGAHSWRVMDEQLMSSFRWLDESEPDLSLGYYDLHALKPVEVGGKGSVQTLINKRYRFLTNVSLGRNGKQNRPTSKSSHAPTEVWANTWRQSSMPPVPSIPTHASSCSRPSMSHMDSRSPRSSHGQRPANTPPPAMPNRSPLPQTGNAAEHYLDPEARLKLRLYLATPSKFDEALEFGFPPVQSSAHPRTSTSSRIQPSLVSHSRSRKSSSTALRHQPSTFPDDCPPQGGPSDVYERETMTTLSSASRPSSSYYGDSDDAGPPTPQASSPTSLAPRFVGCPQGWVDAETELERDPYSIASHGREMTLRMTLTRPDLRADESVPYPSVVRHASILKRGSVRSSAGGRSVATAKMSQDRRIPGLDGLRLDDGTAVGVEKKEGGLRKLLARRW